MIVRGKSGLFSESHPSRLVMNSVSVHIAKTPNQGFEPTRAKSEQSVTGEMRAGF